MEVFIATRCPQCNECMKVVATSDGRTGFQCLQCDKAAPLQTDAMKGAGSRGPANKGKPETSVVCPQTVLDLELNEKR
jgi:hypothetical protein